MNQHRFSGTIEGLVHLLENGSPRFDTLETRYAQQLNAYEPGMADPSGIAEAALAGSLTVKYETTQPMAVAAAKYLRSQGIIEHGLKALDEAHRAALQDAGLSSQVIDLLKSWLDATVETRLLQRDIELSRTAAVGDAIGEVESQKAAPRDPLRALSADELGSDMGVSGETVRLREKGNELFSILRPGRKRGREYPAFQAWPGIVGTPLKQILAQLKPSDAFGAYAFFSSPNELLLGLTPIEVLSGSVTKTRSVTLDARNLLASPEEDRLNAVREAARTEAGITNNQG